MDATDKELITRYRRGQVEALERLVEKHQRSLFGYIVHMTEGRDDADDIFQEVWLRVLRKLGSYKHGNLGGWLVRIARNVIIDRARRKRQVVSLDSAEKDGRSLHETFPAGGADPAREVENEELGRRIRQAVAGLPPEQREVFLMRTQSGLSFREIAAAQRVSINTALGRMHYAVGRLRCLLNEEYDQLHRS